MWRARALLPVLVLCCPVQAEDDLAYVQALADRGFFDLAREVCDGVRNDAAAPDEVKAAVDLALAGILRREAEAAGPDLARREGGLDQAAALAKGFAAAHAGHPRVPEARLLLGEIARDRAKAVAGALRPEPDATKRKRLAARADAAFVDAEEAFHALADDLAKGGAKREDPTFLRASHDAPLVRFERAMATPSGKGRDTLLASAIQGMDSFRWAFDGFAAAYDLAVTEGIAAAELRQYAKAAESFDAVIALADGGAIDAATRPILFRALLAKATVLAAIEDPAEGKTWWPVACEVADRAAALVASAGDLARVRRIPDEGFFDDPETRACVFRALIEKSRALARMGDREAAIVAATMAASEAGPWQDDAKRLLAEIAGAAGGEVPLPTRMTLLESCLRREDWEAAAAQARLAIEACHAPADMRASGVVARRALGIALQQLERFREAAQAFEGGVAAYEAISDRTGEEEDRAAECAYRAASCWARQGAAGGDADDDAAYDRCVKLLVDRFPSSPYSANAPYIVGERLERQGKWEEAAEAYAKVPEKAEARGLALSRIGACHAQLARQLWADAQKDSARNAALEGQAKAAFAKAEEELRASAADPAAGFLLVSVLAHDAVRKYADALPVLDGIERASAGKADLLARAKGWRVDLLVALAGDSPDGLARADEALSALLLAQPESPRVVAALQRIGAAWDRAAATAKDDATRVDCARRAGTRLRQWIEESMKRGEAVKADDAIAVVDRLLALGEEGGGPDDVEAARAIAEAAVTGRFGACAGGADAAAVRLARAQLRSGFYAAALPAFERLHDAAPTEWGLAVELAQVYLGLGRAGESSYHDRALKLLMDLVAHAEDGSEPYWRAWCELLEALFEGAEYVSADTQLASLELRHPRFDEGRFGLDGRLRELKRKLGQKLKK